MTNHVHLVVEPGDSVAGLGQLMKRLAGRQNRFVNRPERRSGTLWESRYKSSPIQTDAYFLACCRYVELNPVKAGMVSYPQEYRWSNYSDRVGENHEHPWLDIDPCFKALGPTAQHRKKRYRERFQGLHWTLGLSGNNNGIREIEATVPYSSQHAWTPSGLRFQFVACLNSKNPAPRAVSGRGVISVLNSFT